MTASEAAELIGTALLTGQRDLALRVVLVFHDELARAEPSVRVTLTDAEPATTGDDGWDAFLAAVVDHNVRGADRPSWTRHRNVESWYVNPEFTEPVLRFVRESTPNAFRTHGVWFSAADLPLDGA